MAILENRDSTDMCNLKKIQTNQSRNNIESEKRCIVNGKSDRSNNANVSRKDLAPANSGKENIHQEIQQSKDNNNNNAATGSCSGSLSLRDTPIRSYLVVNSHPKTDARNEQRFCRTQTDDSCNARHVKIYCDDLPVYQSNDCEPSCENMFTNVNDHAQPICRTDDGSQEQMYPMNGDAQHATSVDHSNASNKHDTGIFDEQYWTAYIDEAIKSMAYEDRNILSDPDIN